VTTAAPTETAVTLPVFGSTFATASLSEENAYAPALPGVIAAFSALLSPTPSVHSVGSSDTLSGAGSTVSLNGFFAVVFPL